MNVIEFQQEEAMNKKWFMIQIIGSGMNPSHYLTVSTSRRLFSTRYPSRGGIVTGAVLNQ
jgi:hypothetical protein